MRPPPTSHDSTGDSTLDTAAWTPPTWEEIVQQHSARVYRLAYRLTGNPHDAEDLTHDVFIRVFRSLNSYTPGTFEGWLHRITTNVFLDKMRRKQRIRFDALPEDAASRMASREPGPAQTFDDTHFDDDVQKALDALPPDFRAAVVLCDIEGLSYEEIAATLGVKLGTVRSRIHRGRAQLREALAHRAPQREVVAARPPPPVPRSGPPGCCRGRADRMSRHLGMQVSAYVDHRLDARAEHAFDQHLAVCLVCRHAADEERRLLTSLRSGPTPGFSADLQSMLLAMAQPAPAAPSAVVSTVPDEVVRCRRRPHGLAALPLPAERPTADPAGSRVGPPAARPDRGAGLAGAAPVSSPCRGDRGSRRGRLGGRRHRPGRRRPGSRRLGLAPVDATSDVGSERDRRSRDVRRVRTHVLTTATGAPAPGAVK